MIRIATIQDAPDVAKVLIESRKAFLSFAPLAHPEEDVRRWVREELMLESRVFVWQVEKVLAGFIALTQLPGGSWIKQLFLLPGWTGHGIGAALLERAHAELEPPIYLYTFQENLGARRFYERHGYVPIEYTDGQGNEENCPDVLYVRYPRTEA